MVSAPTTPSPYRRPSTPRAPLGERLVVRGALLLAVAALTLAALAPLSASDRADAPADGVAADDLALADTTPNPVTPGDFTGYGFDQCLAPSQKAMNTWLNRSPFLAVGIYISGKSRACRSQPNLTPAWVRTQLAYGWRLLPITLGPQASCSTRFPRYGNDPTISPRPGAKGRYPRARRMAVAEANTAVAEARRLGIVPRSTLWYDLEAFDLKNKHCRESALHFVSAWTTRLRQLGYVSGVYSSAGSGIKAIDDARVHRPRAFDLPARIWVARWDNVANTSTSYIREDGWRPGGRVKQYQGGHDETWGGVRINIDRNYLDLGKGSVAPAEERCNGLRISYRRYPALALPSTTYTPSSQGVKIVQCLLREQGSYRGRLTGKLNPHTSRAISGWQTQRRARATGTIGRADWMRLHSYGTRPVLKIGSAGNDVRRLQRSLNAAGTTPRARVSGVYDARTASAVRSFQRATGLFVSGIADGRTWRFLYQGRS